MKSVSRTLPLLLAAGLALVIYFVGVRPRLRASAELADREHAMDHPPVNVVIALPIR